MSFVQFSKVSLAFGARDILKDASLNLAKGSRAALSGPNGAGKSTLMKIIAGLIPPDSGERAVQKDTRVSYLPQYGIVHEGSTLYAEAERAFEPVAAMIRRMEALGARLESATEDTQATASVIQEYHDLQEKVEESGYWRRDEQIERVLSGLGFSRSDFPRQVEEFSGGWQMRVALAKTLLESPDILLLDEPTNYLDIEARNWLEGWLEAFHGGFLIVSHDRYFLDVTVNEVFELFGGKLTRYAGNYSAYETRRAKELEQLFELWERQQEEIQKLEDFIRRFRYNSSKAALVQSRVKQLEGIVPIIIPEGMKRIHFRFPDPPHSGRMALEIKDLRKSYGDNHVIDGLDFILDAHEKVALVGRNGAGKSTLMRIIAGVDTGFTGLVRPGAGIKVGYFSQDNADTLKGSASVEEEIESIAPQELFPKVRSLLGAFLFRGDDVFKSVSVLSGGERSRLALLKILLHPANFLVLDEPTNHLDLTSKDVLLDALKSFDGTVMFVSHDRYFLEACATKVLELGPSGPKFYPGDYRYYLHQKEREALRDAGEAATPVSASGMPGVSGAEERKATSSFQSREDEKRKKAAVKKLRKREEELMAAIEATDQEHRDVTGKMSLPEYYSDGAKIRPLAERAAQLERRSSDLQAEWESVCAELCAAGEA